MDSAREQQESSSSSEDERDTSMEQEEQEDERETRRIRRELLNTDPSILYESDDPERQGPVTRAMSSRPESMEIPSEQPEGEASKSEQPAHHIPPPPPPPPVWSAPIGPQPESRAGTERKKVYRSKPKYSNMCVNKVAINVVKAKSGTNTSGVPDCLAGPGPNSCSGPGSTSAPSRSGWALWTNG